MCLSHMRFQVGYLLRKHVLKGIKHDALQPKCMCLKASDTGSHTKWGIAEIAVLTRSLQHCRPQVCVKGKIWGATCIRGRYLRVYGALLMHTRRPGRYVVREVPIPGPQAQGGAACQDRIS